MTPTWLPLAGGIVPSGTQDGPFQEDERFANAQRALERGRAEYGARRYDEVQKLLDELIPQLRDLAGGDRTREPTDHALLYASALVLQARVHWRLSERARADRVAADAHRHVQHQLFAEALKLFRQHQDALREHPAESRLYTDFGIALYRTGSLTEAIVALRRSLATGIPPVEAFGYLGMSLSDLGWNNHDPTSYQQAIQELRKGLQLAPRDRLLLETLAITQERAGDKQHAVRTYCQAAIEAGTDNDVQAARGFLVSAIKIVPDDPQALCMLTLLLRSQGRQPDALRLLDRTLERFPKHPWALGLRGMIHGSEGKIDEALEDFAEAEVDGPALAWIWLEHAKVLVLRDQDAAEALVERAAKLLKRDDPMLRQARVQVTATATLIRAGQAAGTFLQPIASWLADVPIVRRVGQMMAPGYLDRLAVWARGNDPDALREAVQRLPDHAGSREALARLLFERGNYDEAADILEEAIRIAPNRTEPREDLARVHLARKRFAEAAAVLDEALVLWPESLVVLRLRAEAALKQGKPAEAARFCFRALRAVPTDEDVFEALVMTLQQAGHDLRALRDLGPDDFDVLEQAVAQRPEHTEGCDALGIVLFARGDLDGAIGAFEKAIGLAPERIETREWLVRVYLARSQYDKASAVVEEGLRRAPEAAGLLRLRGDVLGLLGKQEDALSFYLRAVRAAPTDDVAFDALIRGLIEGGREDEALLEVERKLKAMPGHGKALLQRGLLMQRMGRTKDSIEPLRAAEQALTDPGELLDARIALGNALRDCNDHETALEVFDRAIEVDNELGDARAYKAWLLVDTADYKRAVSVLQEAMARLSKDKEQHRTRFGWLLNGCGWALYCDGNTGMADLVAIFEESNELMPDSPYTRRNLAQALLRLDGRREEGRKVMEELAELGTSQVPPHFTGWCHFWLGRFEAAEHWLEAAASSEPENAAIVFDLSHTQLAQGKPSEEFYQKAKDCVRRHDLPRQRGLFHVALMDITGTIREGVVRWDQGIDRWRDLRESLLGARFPKGDLAALELLEQPVS
jgi:tetratricopeptide (TPR) repeat protein